MRCEVFVLFASLLLAVTLSGAAWAQPAAQAPPEAPAFFLESIRVESLERASAEVIVAESRLEPERSYTERQLLRAMFRIQRLPFVLDAGFVLAKGSRRETYVLIIQVQETTRFFYGFELEGFRFSRPLALEDSFASRESTTVGSTLGVRQFLGQKGMAFATLSGENFYEVGYTHYDLFGEAIFASASYSRNDCCAERIFPIGLDPIFSHWQLGDAERLSVSGGIPLTGSQSLQITFVDLDSEGGERQAVLSEPSDREHFELGSLRYRQAEARWSHDTTDDPLLPDHGLRVSGGISLERLESRQEQVLLEFAEAGGPTTVPTVERRTLPLYEARFIGAGLSARRFWPVTLRTTASLGASVFVGRSAVENLFLDGDVLEEESLTSFQGGLQGEYSVSLWDARRSRKKQADLRLVLAVEYSYETLAPDLDLPNAPLERLQVGASVLLRNRWGVLRMGFFYVQVGDVLR